MNVFSHLLKTDSDAVWRQTVSYVNSGDVKGHDRRLDAESMELGALSVKWPSRAGSSWDGGVDGGGEFRTFYA